MTVGPVPGQLRAAARGNAGVSALSDVSVAYLSALAGEPVWARTQGGVRLRLPMRRWLGFPDAAHRADEALIRHCDGPSLDIGCGPGRLVADLLGRGVPALGIDTDAIAIAVSRRRGAPALCRDVFDPVPGQGRWRCALLADGNIGIGADPVRLLRRVRELLAPDGVAIVEFASAGVGLQSHRIRLETGGWSGSWFAWAQVGVDAAGVVAERAGLRMLEMEAVGGRHIGLLAHEIHCCASSIASLSIRGNGCSASSRYANSINVRSSP
ncbi:class I SAM-dependent methyltransferase [Nocardia miyunensis]|uniref:methyltransferase domain-containing protein n=1 Tax=Nocardia miyunensis TaxID=282684 RepID=UPI000A3E28D1|nr:class I SAM-dependent methyltransferase [Nocardia miyunensis]